MDLAYVSQSSPNFLEAVRSDEFFVRFRFGSAASTLCQKENAASAPQSGN